VIVTLDAAGVVQYAGPSTKNVLSVRANDLTGKNWLDWMHRDDRKAFHEALEKVFQTGHPLPHLQFRFHKPDGSWLYMEGEGRLVNGPSGMICILNCHDVSHRVKLEEELRSLALRDELTGLHNRRSFVTFFEQQLKQSDRATKKSLYLLFIDLDKFKWINDNLGHKEGDRALIGAAQVLKTTFREADVIARLERDEFVVLLTEGQDLMNVEGLKKRLQDGLDAWNGKETRAYKLLMSVGVVHHDLRKRRPAEEILLEADELMYRQKREKKMQRTETPQSSLTN
jgi:diguanylate cyclase (GGDEF)-like protein/PAS domain S-box-containing protein